MLSNILNIYCKNIFNNFLIAESCRTRTHLFQKLPSPAPAPAPAPESRNAPVLHRYLVGLLDFGYLLGFDFHKCKYAQLHVFFSPNLHAPCTPRFRFYFFFVIGFNFVGLFNLSLLDFCTCYFSFTS